MFKNLRKLYYNWQTAREFKKNTEQVDKKMSVKAKSGSGMEKKRTVIFFIVPVVVTALIILAVISSNGGKRIAVEETTAEETTAEETVTVEETTAEETTIEEVTTEEITAEEETAKKEKKQSETTMEEVKEEKTKNNSSSYNYGSTGNPTQNSEKSTKKKETATTQKANNTVPSYVENNKVIGSSNMNLIRNTVMSSLSGSYSKNMENLAVYMADNGLSNAQSAVEAVCGYTTLSCSAKTASTTCASTDSGDVTNAARELAKSLTGSVGTYGIGIKATFKNNRYHIYVVVTMEK